ncbi:patched domain-containing protein 3-like [Anabrus simplex]|uniref:patched domain-containing protein 3-like n=1 Tax=Anabrus simplex TaxID=316456 RepID=UPI0035A28D30
MKTVSLIGSAIFNGGMSTFLAFALLGFSDSYLFVTFFKLFTGVVVFGVFHGLFFLPVVLSWFGPEERKPVPQVKDGFHTTRSEDFDEIEQNSLTKTAASSQVDNHNPCVEATSSLVNN